MFVAVINMDYYTLTKRSNMSAVKPNKYRQLNFIRRIVTIAAILLITPCVSTGEMLRESDREYEIKAAFLFNFAKLTEWPKLARDAADDHFVLCVLGDDPFEGALEKLSGRAIGEMKLSIKNISSIREIPECRILFVAVSERPGISEIMNHVKNKPVLTVLDFNGFRNEGEIISFIFRDRHVGFRINLNAAQKANLRLSSHLLEAADTVADE